MITDLEPGILECEVKWALHSITMNKAAAAKSLQSCLTLMAAHQAPLSLGFSRQEYTEELYKKDLHDPDNHDGVITHLKPGILECEVKWALESITTSKASGGDGIPVELFQILKDDALNMPANLENSAVATGLEKVSFHSNPKEREC